MNSNTFSPAPYQILVAPEKDENVFSGVKLAVADNDLPIGIVVVCGSPPKGYPKLHPGDRIVFNRGIATFITVNRDGKQENCRVVSYIDYRGKFKKNDTLWYKSVLRSPYFIGFSAGVVTGAIFKTQFWFIAKAYLRFKFGETYKAVSNLFAKNKEGGPGESA